MNGSAGRPLVRAPRDLATGVLFAAIGAVGLGYSLQWPTGTPMMMDSGFFPQFLSTAILLSGVFMIVKAFIKPGEGMPGIALRPVLAVTLAVIGFALTIEWIGLLLAILAVVAIGSLGGASLGVVAFPVLWLALFALCYLVFIWGVDLPLKVWPF